MSLHGGGDEPLSSGGSGWGALPPVNASAEWGSGSTNNANHWPNNSRQVNCDQNISTSPKPSSSWAQLAGKGLNSGPNHDLSVFGGTCGTYNGFANDNSVKSSNAQFDIRSKEVALISDNWGNSVINQDSPWKLPPSPQSSPKESSASTWKSNTNAGTDIWENAVRHKSKGPAPSPSASSISSAQPWGPHTPSTHIGGTWGEDEDPSNHWTGVPQNTNNANIWSANSNSNNNNNNNNVTNNPTNNDSNNMQWNSTESNGSASRPKANQSWNDYGNEQNDSSEPMWRSESKPNNNNNNNNNNNANNESFGTWAPESTQKKDCGHKSGWSAENDSKGGYDDGTAVWGNPTRQGKVNNWKETAGAKPITNSCANGPNGPNGNNASPVVVTANAAMMTSSPGMIRLPVGTTTPVSNKSEPIDWPKTQSNSQLGTRAPWTEVSTHRDSPNNNISVWADNDIKNISTSLNSSTTWADTNNSSPLAYWSAKPKAANSVSAAQPSWSDGQIDTSTWGGPKQGKPLSKDIIWASKQFRILTDMGFKKDDVENALRNCGMKLEDAVLELKAASARDVNALDLELARIKSCGMNSNTPNSLLTSTTSGVANSSLTSINRNPSLGSMLQQTQQQSAPQQSFSQANQVQSALSGTNPSMGRIGSAQSNPIPNAAQLRVLVQQIQLAVNAGHLNAQILNQPLAPQTLQLLYQLLQQIKILHQLQLMVNKVVNNSSAPNAAAVTAQSSFNVQITQTKQRILNLQNQIAAQQAIFLKENGGQQVVPPSPSATVSSNNHNTTPNSMHSQTSSNSDFFKTQDNSMVTTSDRELTSQLSRFQTTWKAPNFNNKDEKININLSTINTIPNEFSRAPGPPLQKQNSMLSRSDSNWSGFSSDDSGWPSDGISNISTNMSSISVSNSQKHAEMKDMAASNSLSSMHDVYNDLVPEFEPGKPWKGANMKNIEDDPTITPGSVTRSPLLSINTIKDTTLFNWPSKLSPGANNSAADTLSALTLSSSTWAFNPTNSHVYSANAGDNKPKNMKSPGWGSTNSGLQLNSCNDNLWSDATSKPRGPPPGLTQQIKSVNSGGNAANANVGLGAQSGVGPVGSAHNLWDEENHLTGSEVLLLRNLLQFYS